MSHQAGPPAGALRGPEDGAYRYLSRWLGLDALAEADWRRWDALARTSVDGNPFLAPWFVRPALHHLEPDARLDVLWVERDAGEPSATPAAVLLARRNAAPRRSLPRPHLEAWRGLHAYTSGALLWRDDPAGARRALLAALAANPAGHGALRLSNLRTGDDGCLLGGLTDGTSGLRWYPTRAARRAAWRRTSAGAEAPSATRGAAEMADPAPADLRRARVRLEREFGALELRLLRGATLTDEAVERHLALEAAGWKAGAGSALLAAPTTAAFFRECVAGARAADAALFCELWAGDTPVASTSNFVCGGVLSAFKVGWEPRAARASPGLLVDHALAAIADRELPDVALIDSCADPGSYLERVWPARIAVADGYLAWGRMEQAALGALASARALRARLRGARDESD